MDHKAKKLNDVMAERDYAYKLAKRSRGKQVMWDNYRALNSALRNGKVENLTFQLQEGERMISELKAVCVAGSK